MRSLRVVLLVSSVALLMGVNVFAGTDAGTATAHGVNTAPTVFTLSPGRLEEWFLFNTTVGRSYCVEVARHALDLQLGDSQLFVYGSDAATLIGFSDDDQRDPPAYRGSRVCFQAPPAALVFARVTQCCQSAGTTTSYTLRIVETTLFSPYYAVGGGYDAAPQIKNNTNATVNVYFTAYDNIGVALSGCPATAIGIPPNGMTTISISSRCATSSALAARSSPTRGPPGPSARTPRPSVPRADCPSTPRSRPVRTSAPDSVTRARFATPGADMMAAPRRAACRRRLTPRRPPHPPRPRPRPWRPCRPACR